MSKLYTLLLAFVAPFALLAADDLPVIELEAAPITAVKVHLGWAEIERTVTLPPGPARRLRLENLEKMLIAASLRGAGPAFVTATASGYQVDPKDNPELEKAQEAVAAGQQNLSDLHEEDTLLLQFADNLQRLIDWKVGGEVILVDGSSTSASRTLSSDEIDAIAKLNGQLADNLKAKLALQKKIREAEKAVAKAEKNLQKLMAKPAAQYARIDLDVVATAEASELKLFYSAAAATWHPEVEASFTKGDLRLDYRALVTQDTGVDWLNVPVSLHHGSPDPGWLKNYYTKKEFPIHQAHLKARGILQGARTAGVPTIWASTPKVTVPTNNVAATVAGPSVTPEATRKWTLDASRKDSATTVLTLKNEASSGLPSALLSPGAIAVSQLPAIPGGGSVTVPLQPEMVVTATRTPLPGNPAQKLGGYRLAVSNTSDAAVTVELFDALAKHQFLSASPAATIANQYLSWTLTIPPKATKSVTWTYKN